METLKQYRVPIALVALIGLAVAAYFASRRTEVDPGTRPDLTVIRSVAKDRVDELEIRRPDEPAIRLAKRDGRWRVVAPVEADADQSAVDTALERLAELEVRGVAATRRETHDDLEITEAKGLRVIARGRGTVLTELIIGAYRNGKTLARRPQDATVFMLEGAIRYAFNKALKDWRDRGVVDVPVGDIVEVRFQNANGVFSFVKHDDEWAVAEGATAIDRFQASKVASIVSSLARLRASDFAEEDVTADAAGVGASVIPPSDGGAPSVSVVTLRTRASDAGPAHEISIRIGNARGDEDREYYALRQGTDTIFVISKYLADRLRPAMDAFQSPPDAGPRPDGGAAAPPEEGDGEGAGEGEGGGPGGPGGAMPQGIPPEIMRQLQKQLQQRGAGGGAPPPQ